VHAADDFERLVLGERSLHGGFDVFYVAGFEHVGHSSALS
jgi:hypothetical protein